MRFTARPCPQTPQLGPVARRMVKVSTFVRPAVCCWGALMPPRQVGAVRVNCRLHLK